MIGLLNWAISRVRMSVLFSGSKQIGADNASTAPLLRGWSDRSSMRIWRSSSSVPDHGSKTRRIWCSLFLPSIRTCSSHVCTGSAMSAPFKVGCRIEQLSSLIGINRLLRHIRYDLSGNFFIHELLI